MAYEKLLTLALALIALTAFADLGGVRPQRLHRLQSNHPGERRAWGLQDRKGCSTVI